MRGGVERIAGGGREKENKHLRSKLWGFVKCTYLPGVACGFIPRIFVLHGGVYLTDRELPIRATQNGTPEDYREGMRRPAIGIPQAVQARWAMGVLLMLYGTPPLSYLRSARNTGVVQLTRYLRLSIVVRIDWGALAVDPTSERDNRSAT